MWKKIGKYTGFTLLVLLGLSITGYISIVCYYQNNFILNTWINGVYCSGKTVEEINTELLFHTEAPVITILGENGESEKISLVQADYRADYKTILNSYIAQQNSLLWPKYVFSQNNVEVLPEGTWNEEKLTMLILASEIVQEQIRSKDTIDVKITLDENGYSFYDGMQHVFDEKAFVQLILQNAHNGIYSVKISDESCYYNATDNEQQAMVRALWNKLNEFLNVSLTYDMGTEKIVFDKALTSTLVLTDDNGEFILDANGNFLWDMEKADSFVDDLCQKYNTCDTILEFTATSGTIVEVPYDTYGTKLDAKAEKEYLRKALLNRVEEIHVPTYLQEGYTRGLNDIGDTYIEVDMTAQKLYGYKAGECIVETDIVTGNMKRKWDTPVGVNFVYNKQKNRVLRGQNYATPVDFWMPVNGAIGIHDADWRDEFGGDIYLKNGSHGCINVPVDIMPTIYDEFEIGTPVIMFY